MKILATLILGLALVCATATAQANMLTNPGFETADDGSGAQNWFGWYDPENGVSLQRVTDVFHNGGASANTKFTGTTGYTIGGWGQVLTGWTAGQTLYTNMWTKVSVIGDAYAQLKFEAATPDGTVDFWGPSTSENSWAQLTYNFTIPSDTTELRMLGVHVASAGTNNGDIYFDDAYADTTPIPEPASLILLGSGLLGLFIGGFRKRKVK